MGAKAGAVPDMEARIQRFVDKGYDSRHFADQDFLAEDLWGYIRQDVFSHDRVFNFCNAKPFLESFTLIIKLRIAKEQVVLMRKPLLKKGAK